MPHVIIEHSIKAFDQSLNQRILASVAKVIEQTLLFNIDNIKVRLHPVSDYLLAKDLEQFIHIQCRIHIGRSEAQKTQLSQAVLDAITGYTKLKTVITVEVVDMDTSSYSKQVIS